MAEVTVNLDDLKTVMQWAEPRIIEERGRGFPPVRVMEAIDRMAAQITDEWATQLGRSDG